MSKHKWYDVIVAMAEGKAVQWRYNGMGTWWEYNSDDDFSPFNTHDSVQWCIKPKEPVKKYRVAFAQMDCGHEYVAISQNYYSSTEEFRALDVHNFLWAVLLEPTMKEFEE